ncbi:MAG TPA: hypothetical protein PKE69_21790 [Pyrinomonadaceae bacterium]|nr:hypothetical protein [Pyrinomonadaceae bacterium]
MICRPTFYDPNVWVHGGMEGNERVQWSQTAYNNNCIGTGIPLRCEDKPPARIVDREESCFTDGPIEELQSFE